MHTRPPAATCLSRQPQKLRHRMRQGPNGSREPLPGRPHGGNRMGEGQVLLRWTEHASHTSKTGGPERDARGPPTEAGPPKGQTRAKPVSFLPVLPPPGGETHTSHLPRAQRARGRVMKSNAGSGCGGRGCQAGHTSRHWTPAVQRVTEHAHTERGLTFLSLDSQDAARPYRVSVLPSPTHPTAAPDPARHGRRPGRGAHAPTGSVLARGRPTRDSASTKSEGKAQPH